MTLSDLDAKSAALEALRAKWEAKLLPRVTSVVADAHAHAVKALTDALKSTPDGRATVLRLNRSPSFVAAGSRLDELLAWLAGAGETSLKGKVRDAREDLLKLAIELWFPLVREDYRSRVKPEPTADEVRQVRAAMPHGFDPRKFLLGPVTTAKATLKAALEQAGRKSTPEHVSDDLLAAWELRTASTLRRAVVTLLNDSCTYADTTAGVAMVHPDRIGDDE